VITRGLALAAHGRSQRSDQLTLELERLQEVAQKMGYKPELRAIEEALNSA